MDLGLNLSLTAGTKGGSQIARILTEDWVSRELPCISCGRGPLSRTKSNTKALDFVCSDCSARFELKAKRTPFHERVVDGAYDSLMAALQSDLAPNLLLMRYDLGAGRVEDLFAVHRALLTPISIEKRPPLSTSARRAGWVGCNINLTFLPAGALVPVIRRGVAKPLAASRWDWSRFEYLTRIKPGDRGWLTDVLACIQQIPGGAFALEEVYRFEEELARVHPRNQYVRPKIRQQMQLLVKRGLIRRLAPGLYHRMN